jgi:hypothetical protein
MIRGDIPRSKLMERALTRFLDDVKEGRVDLIPHVRTGPDKTISADVTTAVNAVETAILQK